ncbi:MAG TPA: type II toxin-antitoxin system VapC family toxin [Ktedonobacteraceae bacterium]|nr:type II toxin-antitoxin system VapC family toxin [Ktedonobacteraceae bacterium]
MSKDSVVVDTSVAIKWAIKEEDSHIALALLSEWTEKGMIILAPGLLSYEAANVLHQSVRKGRLSLVEAQDALSEIIFDIVTFDFAVTPDLSIRAIQLAQQFRLPAAYDAQYVALAESKACELWTADLRMWNSLQGKLGWVHWMPNYTTT